MKVEDATSPWDAREKEIIMEIESYLRALLRSGDKICIATIAELAVDGRHARFCVNKELLEQRCRRRCALCRTGTE